MISLLVNSFAWMPLSLRIVCSGILVFFSLSVTITLIKIIAGILEAIWKILKPLLIAWGLPL